MLSIEELHLRAALLDSIRRFFSERNFLEVNTPSRLPVVIPEEHIVPIRSAGAYLQTSPELCMKRLLAQGCSRIFQICQCFRKDEKGHRHLEEFTMLEWYRAGADYYELMDDCERLLQTVVECIHSLALSLGVDSASMRSLARLAQEIGKKWQRLSVAEAFRSWSPVPLHQAIGDDIFDEILVEHIEHRLGVAAPTFLYDYPVELASLARRKSDDATVAERFELYLHGVELANGFSELTDAAEQRKRFEREIGIINRKRGEQCDMPERFLEDLNKLGDAAGIAFGVDRLFMLLLGKDTIHDAVTFSPDDM